MIVMMSLALPWQVGVCLDRAFEGVGVGIPIDQDHLHFYVLLFIFGFLDIFMMIRGFFCGS